MDSEAFYKFVNTVEFDKKMTFFWAPEKYIDAFFSQATDDEKAYVESCTRAFDKVYNGRGYEIIRVTMVLTENYNSFKNRLNGTIKDDWLSEKTFGSIAPDCVTVLDTLSNLEDWQVKLRDMFVGMKWAEEPKVPQEVLEEELEKDNELSNISDEHMTSICAYIIRSCQIFNGGIHNMTTFTNPTIPFHEIIEVYKVFRNDNPDLMQHVRSAVGEDGIFTLVYMPPQPEVQNRDDNKDKENDTIELNKIVI